MTLVLLTVGFQTYRLDKPARLIIRLSFGFVSDSETNTETNTETAMLSNTGDIKSLANLKIKIFILAPMRDIP